MRKFLVIFILGIVLFIISCTTPSRLTTVNFSGQYQQQNQKVLHPKFIIFHLTDSISQLHFKINAEELLYAKKEKDGLFKAQVKLKYRIVDSYESTIILDSATTFLYDNGKPSQHKEIIGYVNIKVPMGKNAVLLVETIDLYRNNSVTNMLLIDKTNSNSRQNYLFTDTKNNPIFRNYIYAHETVIIRKNTSMNGKFYGKYYDRNFQLSAPPFSTYIPSPFDFSEDSLFVILPDSNHITLQPEKEGIYHFVNNPMAKTGVTLYVRQNKFPELFDVKEMIYPLRFITSKREYEGMLFAKNQKLALDAFWLNIALSKTRAKELIKSFYGRVVTSNTLFTSHKEGWRTDRGMIYLIFGPPNSVYKTTNSESWIYGQENNYMSINFIFRKINNPFSDNDYSLNRSAIYKANWYRMVDSWRQGRVYVNN